MPKVVGVITDYTRPDGTESYGAVGWYRVKNPLEKMGHEVLGKLKLGGTPAEAAGRALELKMKGDIWFFKPVDNEGMAVLIDTAKKFTGAKLILDIDDEVFDILPGHPLYDEIKSKSPRVAHLINIADHLVVTNEYLKKALLQHHPHIAVIPNAIDPKIWEVKKPKKRTDGKIRIGWVASGSHMVDIPVVNKAFEEILKKYPQVEIHLCGFVANESERNNREFHHPGTMNYETYPQFLADLDLDIAIAPLGDNHFNRCKSNIKWLENSMLKTPMVLSDVRPYSESVENHKTGYLAKSHSQWVKYLSWLIENEEKRKEIGEAAYKEVMDHWTIDKFLPLYERLFQKMDQKNITVYTSITGDKNQLLEDGNFEGATFVAFTNGQSEHWQIKKPYEHFKSDRRNSRIQKLMPHLFFNSEYSVYLDGNIRLKVPAQKLIDEYLKDKDIAVFRHVGRDCLYDESNACIMLKKGDPMELAEQCSDYAQRGWKEHAGLYECGVIIRRHTPEINAMGEKWWAHYCRYSERDQVSFPIAFPKEAINPIEGSAWRHPYFDFIGHKHDK